MFTNIQPLRMQKGADVRHNILFTVFLHTLENCQKLIDNLYGENLVTDELP